MSSEWHDWVSNGQGRPFDHPIGTVRNLAMYAITAD